MTTTTLKPMKLSAVRQLIVDDLSRGEPSAEAIAWLDRLRFKGWAGAVAPFTYSDLLAFMQHGKPDLDRAEWDAFLARCDEVCNREG